MAQLCCDTSFLFSLYGRDANSARVRRSDPTQAGVDAECAQRLRVSKCVEWSQSWEGEREFGAANAALLLAGVLSWQRSVVTSTFPTHAAGCSACAKKRLLLDRFERFFGPVPGDFKRGRVQVTPLPAR